MYYLSLVHLYQKLFPNLYYVSCPFTFIWADGYTYMNIYRYDPLIFPCIERLEVGIGSC